MISKFRFSMPSKDDDNHETLQHDNDHDLLVRRKKNEFLEIGKKKTVNIRIFFRVRS